MKVLNFLESLLPSIKKSRIEEEMRLCRAEITEHTAPAYKSAEELLGKWKFKSPDLQPHLEMFNRMVKTKGNFVTTVEASWKDIIENLDYVEEQIAKTYNEEMASAGYTYLKANLLQMSSAYAFVSKFARKFLIYIYICETAMYEESNTILSESLSPAEIEWIKANFISFCTAFNIVSGKPQQIQKEFANIPDIIITEDNVHTLGATIGAAKLDPFQMGLIPIWMNPIYHIGMFVAEWQADRYKAAKEEVKLIQLRKLNLEKLSEGKPDARIQKEIAYMETRIQGINYKIEKMEKDNE